MSAFLDDHTEDMKDPEYAYEFGRNERELEIIKLLQNPLHHNIRFPDEHIDCYTCVLIALIKGEK